MTTTTSAADRLRAIAALMTSDKSNDWSEEAAELDQIAQELDREAATEAECEVCGRNDVVNDACNLCYRHDHYRQCAACETYTRPDDLYAGMCPGCVHDARRSGWEG